MYLSLYFSCLLFWVFINRGFMTVCEYQACLFRNQQRVAVHS